MKRFNALVVPLLWLVGCSGSGSSAKPAVAAAVVTVAAAAPVAVSTPIFEPVYRAAKALQGATVSGVTYIKFGELMQGLATEIGIAGDHKLNAVDKELLELYRAAFADYQASARIWKLKLGSSQEMWKGEIPVSFQEHPNDSLVAVANSYGLPVENRTVQYGQGRYKTIPGNSVQVIWQHADVTLAKATTLYYGKQ